LYLSLPVLSISLFLSLSVSCFLSLNAWRFKLNSFTFCFSLSLFYPDVWSAWSTILFPSIKRLKILPFSNLFYFLSISVPCLDIANTYWDCAYNPETWLQQNVDSFFFEKYFKIRFKNIERKTRNIITTIDIDLNVPISSLFSNVVHLYQNFKLLYIFKF
jgi:hypothetical protein